LVIGALVFITVVAIVVAIVVALVVPLVIGLVGAIVVVVGGRHIHLRSVGGAIGNSSLM
jgi:hypothetical protein